MTSRRDWQLQQLGITQWALRRPTVLQGEVAVTLPAHIRLVMVSPTLPPLTEPLVADVLRALLLSEHQVLQLTPDQVAMLPATSRCNSWRLDVSDPLTLAGAQLSSPRLDELKCNPQARATLWQQICEHEPDFLPQQH